MGKRKYPSDIEGQVKSFLKNNNFDSVTQAHNEFVKQTNHQLSYIYFTLLAKDKGDQETNNGKLLVKQEIKNFLKTRKFKNKTEAHKAFLAESNRKVSYVYFSIITTKEEVKTLEEEPRRKSIHIPQNIQEIYNKWDKLVIKTIRRKGYTDPDEVNEIRQGVYLELCQYYKPEKYDPKKKTFAAYLSRSVQHCMSRYFKKKMIENARMNVSLNDTVPGEESLCLAEVISDTTYAHPNFELSHSRSAGLEAEATVNSYIRKFRAYLKGADEELSKAGTRFFSLDSLYLYLEEGTTLSSVSLKEDIPLSVVTSSKKELVERFKEFSKKQEL